MHLAINLVLFFIFFLSIENIIEHYKSPLNVLDGHCQIKKNITVYLFLKKNHGKKKNGVTCMVVYIEHK